MKVLITGSRGFIGSAVKLDLQLHGHDVLGIDHRDNEDVVGDVFMYLHGALDDFKPDVVLHLAAKVTRASCEIAPLAAIDMNTKMTAFVARACAQRGIKLAYSSTSEVYGDHGTAWIDEETTPSPTSGVYGMTKLWGEELIGHYCGLERPRPLIMRLCMAYGPSMSVGLGKAALPTFIYNAIRGEQILVHRGAWRSWCFIDDLAKAIRILIEQDCHGVWNVGNDKELVRMDHVARYACMLAEASFDLITYVDPPPLQTLVKRISCDKLKRETGWEPQVDIEQGMRLVTKALVAEYRRNAA